MTTTIEIRPTGAALGADVAGAALSDPSDATREQIRAALRDHLVLRFRGTELDDAELCRVRPHLRRDRAARGAHPHRLDDRARVPEMSVISNIIEDGVARGEAGRRRAEVAHRPRLHGAAGGLHHAARARGAGERRRHQLRSTCTGRTRRCRTTLRARVRGSVRQASGEPQLDRPAPARLAGPRQRRSARSAGRRPPDRAHPSGDRAQGAVPRPPLRLLHPAAAAGGKRGAAGRALGARHPAPSSPGRRSGRSAIC